MSGTGPDALMVTPEEAALMLGLSRTRVYDLTRSRVLTSTMVGRRRMIFRESIEAYVRKLREDAEDGS